MGDNPDGSLTLDATWDELAEIAASRTRATGRIVAVACFVGSDRATVVDTGLEIGRDGEPVLGEEVDHGTVPLVHPSPAAGGRLEDRGEAD